MRLNHHKKRGPARLQTAFWMCVAGGCFCSTSVPGTEGLSRSTASAIPGSAACLANATTSRVPSLAELPPVPWTVTRWPLSFWRHLPYMPSLVLRVRSRDLACGR